MATPMRNRALIAIPSVCLLVRCIAATIDVLHDGEGASGVLEFGQNQFVQFSVPERGNKSQSTHDVEVESYLRSQRGYPTAVLTLRVVNTDGRASLGCTPLEEFRKDPNPANFLLRSRSTSGLTTLELSSQTVWATWQHAAVAFKSPDKRKLPGDVIPEFVCTVFGEGRKGTEFAVQLDFKNISPMLVGSERGALKAIHAQCCSKNEPCNRWPGSGPSALRIDDNIGLEDLNIEEEANGTLYVDFCKVEGNVCDERGRIVRLSMWGFGLDCEFPGKQLALLTQLQFLELGDNKLRGDFQVIAQQLEGLKHLRELSLAHNNIHGSLSPTSPENFICYIITSKSLDTLLLDANSITGPIPKCLFDTSSAIRMLSLDDNPISGSLPAINANGSKLEEFSAANANITGTLPPSFANLQSLRVLWLSQNALSGSVPEALGDMETLSFLELESNQLTGRVPASLAGKVSKEVEIILSGNHLDCPDSYNGRLLYGIECGEVEGHEDSANKASITNGHRAAVVTVGVACVVLLSLAIFAVWRVRQRAYKKAKYVRKIVRDIEVGDLGGIVAKI